MKKLILIIAMFFCSFLSLSVKAQQSYDGYIQFAQAIKKIAEAGQIPGWSCLTKLRYDYYWEMADGTVAVNRGVRCYRGSNYVFSSIFDQTSGDCDTEVYQNGKRYRNLCLGNAGGEGRAFVKDHGGIVAFYRK
jgi:hypothetical protein